MSSSTQPKQLVLLDDEPNVLKALTRVLAADGYEIHAFTRPFDALQFLQSTEVDLILSDLCLPQMDGKEFLRQAAAIRPEAVLMTLSGYVEEDRAQGGGGEPWLTLEKPWSDTNLRQVVAEALREAV